MKKILFYLILVLLGSRLYGNGCLKLEDIKHTIVQLNEDEDKVVFRNKNKKILKEVRFLNFVNTKKRVFYKDLNFDNKKEILVDISSHERYEEHKILTIGCDMLTDFSPIFSSRDIEKLLSKAKEIAQQYDKESPEKFKSVVTDTKSYGKGRVGIVTTYYLQSNSMPYTYKLLSIYEKNKVLLSNFKLYTEVTDKWSADYCEDYTVTHEYQTKKSSSLQQLVFEHTYVFKHEKYCKEKSIKKWSVKLDPKKFVLKDGKFVAVKQEKKPIFNLDEVLKNAQKGLRYKKIVLEAMLFEVPVSKDNVELYTQIGQALKKAKHREEAEFLLSSIFKSSFKGYK